MDSKDLEGIRNIAFGFLNIQAELRRPEILSIVIDNVNPNVKSKSRNTTQLKVKEKNSDLTAI
jgi:hypothetical protein